MLLLSRFLLAVITASTALAAAPVRHLFLDPAMVDLGPGVALRVNPPTEGELVLKGDKPWENFWLPFYSTVRDENGKLRMWYNCRDLDGRTNVAYAESTDGVHWTKPELGLVDYHGSKANNLVGIGNLEGAVFTDPNAEPAQRYAYLTSMHKAGGVFRFTSPDGLRWQRDPQPFIPFECDSQNVVFWDAPHNKYAFYFRGWGPKGPRDNRRKVVEFDAATLAHPLDLRPARSPYHENGDKDRQPWIDTEAPTALVCDEQDPAGTDIYTNAIQPYPLDPRWYVGFPAFFRHFPKSPQPIADGWTEVQFVGSSDGAHWQRYDRVPYVGPGLPGPFSGAMVFIGTGLVVRGDEIWQYGTRYRTTHGDIPSKRTQTDGAIYRFVQRVDGFVSADFTAAGGTCRIPKVTIDGARLAVNLDAGAIGQLRVGLSTADGPIPGFAAADCEVVHLNDTHALVAWKGGADLSGMAGREVTVEFAGSRTKLYSFYFVSEATAK
jgi:hypothetical protein